ncbi:mycofactocin-coupled SDR family oxidoreductase [Mycolicibacterium hodleri]|uniref:NAD(P)-dependent oxidoreductase n=1 Tax=Mycolicibacterium hodleri TaxID=49897 RepID=A0A502E422_9MYCO|nr:mycofactocin-coupled SDR family oxidoreductase [Mycolicibacterium hodleri]TPG32488.1 NAD(P)-dependent oxidoreductase [Mycolicibacterium hodleri]
MGKLDGKVALITGGARGQGRSHAVRLAAEGAQIIICDIAEQVESVPYPLASQADLAETAKLVEDEGQRCVFMQVDVREPAQVRALVDRGVSVFGRIDIAVVNHGICIPGGWDTPDDQMIDTLDINLKGSFQVCRAVIPQLIQQGQGGSIVLTASMCGLVSSYGLLAYSMSKHGIVGMVKCLSAELGAHHIRVNSVCPGAVNTTMVVNDHMKKLFSGGASTDPEEALRFGMGTMSLLPDDWAESSDVSNAVAFLASDEARCVTGINMPVDLGAVNQPPGIPLPVAEMLSAAN